MNYFSFIVAALLGLSACTGTRQESQEGGRTATHTAGSSGSVVYGSDLVAAGVVDIEQGLASRVPGLRMQVVNGETRLVIRGVSTFMGDSTPLYVIDGLVLGRSGPSPLRGISVHDIDRIEVLKSASDTALYGVQGGNGVIRIWTRGAVDEGR